MSYSTKYTMDEIKIVRKIHDINSHQAALRKKWLDWDVRKLALIHSLKGKYVQRSFQNKKIKQEAKE